MEMDNMEWKGMEGIGRMERRNVVFGININV